VCFFLYKLAICINLLNYYNQKFIFASDNIWFCTFYLLRAIWNYTNISKPICIVSQKKKKNLLSLKNNLNIFYLKQVSDSGFIPLLLSILSNPNIVDNIDENEEQALKVAINILHNIAQHPETKLVFRDNKATKVFSIIYK
jgi:hypothetical protein